MIDHDARKELAHPLSAALSVAEAASSPEIRIDRGVLGPGWITAAAFVADDEAVEEFLAYQGSFNSGTDRKTCASFMMVDYAYVFSLATVPAFVGSDLLPDCSAPLVALRFGHRQHEHDGHTHEVRRAHVRFLSPRFSTARADDARHPDARDHVDRAGLCELFRLAVEDHFQPLVETLRAKTGISRSALWRLVADALAGRFLEAGRQLGCVEDAKKSAMLILKRDGSPLNNRQLRYFDLSVRDREQRPFTHTFRARGGCCRYYKVASGKLCTICVLKPAKERDIELMLGMRMKLQSG